jgi:hypothetical protein
MEEKMIKNGEILSKNETTEPINIHEQKESVKLQRSVTGKVGWEIKLLSNNIEEEIERLSQIDKKMKINFK